MAFEVAFLLVLGVVLVAGITVVGGPITAAISEKLRYKYRELGSEKETLLKNRIEFLESEVLALKQQLTEIQQSVDFAIKQSDRTIEK